MAKSTRWTVAVAAACSVLLIACGGGSSEEKAVCTHASVPTTGPGDVDHYFPVDVGRTWTYATCCSGPGTQTVTVSTPTTVQGEPVSVFTNTWTIDTYTNGTVSGSGSDAYAVRPAGVYLVSSTDATAPLDQALPFLVLPFPVQVPDQTQQVTCQHLRLAEEGVTFDTDIVVSFRSVVIQPSMTVQAGTFTDVAYVLRVIELTMRAGGTTTTGEIGVSEWYAPGVGLIKEEATLILEGGMWTDGIELTSYAPLSTVGAPTGIRSLAVATDRAVPFSRSPEELALRVARRIARIYR